MSDPKFIKGKITIEFTSSLVPDIKFEGDVDVLSMAGIGYHISTAYSYHLDKLGDELRKKVAQKGIETDKPVSETKEPAIKENTK